MPSPDDIAALAVDMIGQTKSSNLDDDTAEGRKLKRGYDVMLDGILGSYPWKFARHPIYLATTAPLPAGTDWAYAYRLPDDCLQPLRLGEDDRTAWERVGDLILTDEIAPVLLNYTRRVVNPGLWPGAFQIAFITLLASVYAGTLKSDYELVFKIREIYEKVDLPEAKSQDARAQGLHRTYTPELTTDVRRY